MDKELLVNSGHALVRAMDARGLVVRFAMWVHNSDSDSDSWKLWLVPPKDFKDKRDFYRQVSQIVSEDRDKLGGIDIADTEFMEETHPAIEGMKAFIHMEGLGVANFSGNTFNGFYLPNGIVMRSAL